ncbi:MAG: M18 family aminopeptidase [Myxococcales bacterium]
MPTGASTLLDFLGSAKSPYHATQFVAAALSKAGYVELDERGRWDPEPGLRAFVQRGGAAIVAFELGQQPPAEAGYLVIGAHTDSPNLRLKPNYRVDGKGIASLAIEPYGGVLLSTWLDRSLSIAGRCVTRAGAVHLIDIPRPVLTIPSLAIHLQRDVNTQGLILNPQQHLRPILCIDFDEKPRDHLRELLEESLATVNAGITIEEVTSFDLCLLDAVEARLEGKSGDFITSGRIDNLVSCHAALMALLDAGPPTDASRVLVLYDHEEVGSRSFSGAQSGLLGAVLDRIAQRLSPGDAEAAYRATSNSLLLSADMAHAVHPNFPDKHDELHRPVLGKGPVVKTNANQSYATDAVSGAVLNAVAERAGVTLQQYSARNDMPCGSTIGPLTAARQGIRTVDVGNPMLAMHSCRELCATADYSPYVSLLTEWYRTAMPHNPRG